MLEPDLSVLKHVGGALCSQVKDIASKDPSQCQLQALAPVLDIIKVPVSAAAKTFRRRLLL